MRKRLSFFLLVAIMASAAFAQAPDSALSVKLRPGMESLAQGWRTQAGDNLAWAEAGLDDSAWQPAILSANTPLPSGQRWYRLRLHLAADESPIALLIVAPGGSFEVWIDGKRIPGFSIESWLRRSSNREFVIPLPPHDGEVEIAVRVSFPPYLVDTYGGTLSVSAGGIEAVEAAAGAARDRRIFVYLPTALFNIALVLAGIGALILFAAQRSRTEYLWLGLYFAVLGTSTVFWRAVDTGLLPYWTNSLFADPLTYLVEAFQIEFSFAFINRRDRKSVV